MMAMTEEYRLALSATATLVEAFPFLKASATPTEDEYHQALKMVEFLIDNDDENPLIIVLADKIEAYENSAEEFAEFNSAIAALPRSIAMLRTIMDQHGLNQSNFTDEIGGKSLVSMILKGERQLTLEHMKALSKRFNLPVTAFLED